MYNKEFMSSRLKKIISSFLLLLISSATLLSSASPALAAVDIPVQVCPPGAATTNPGTWYDPSFCAFYSKVFTTNPSEIFGERYTYAQVDWILWSLVWKGINFTIGLLNSVLSFYSINLHLASDPSSSLAQISPLAPGSKSSLSASASLPVAYYNTVSAQPISGIKTVLQTLSRFSLVPVAHAQGYGYSA